LIFYQFCLFYLYDSKKNIIFANVIELDKHLELLLLSNDCVIVPGLGGFVAHHIDACYDEEEELMLPPRRALGFNPQLAINDSLLVQSYIEAYDISYPEALRRIEGEVEELKQEIVQNECFEMNGIGTFSLNEEGHYEFEPCEAGLLTPSLYGLGCLNIPLLAETKVEGEETEKHKVNNVIEKVIAVAVAVVCFFLISSPVSNSYVIEAPQQSAVFNMSSENDTDMTMRVVASVDSTLSSHQDSVKKMSIPLDSTTVKSTTETNEVNSQPVLKQKPSHSYVIVLASEITRRNANAYVERLQQKGFDEARMSICNKMVRVVYGSYTTAEEAREALRSLRTTSSVFKEGWVHKQKEDTHYEESSMSQV